ncbi:MAG: imidazoleglycerol-phosphate dehydratase HisB [Planctomycetota bacterium]|nr:imidazoleglycerol-phosphate dehydratase HisB [Planctomycetota bacterium]
MSAEPRRPERRAEINRRTRETQIQLELALDGTGRAEIESPAGFLNHMLTLLARHARVDLKVKAAGDTGVDLHHTVEDIGICLGQALEKALGTKEGITRFASAAVPMDEALAEVALDLSGRPYLVYNVRFPGERIGEFETQLVGEFLQAFVTHAKLTLHVAVPYGSNDHHMAEAVFKALARALKAAVAIDPRAGGVPSTKGVL